MRLLILGATGLVGNTVFRALHESSEGAEILGTVRTAESKAYFSLPLRCNLIVSGDLSGGHALRRLMDGLRPTVVLNCLAIRSRDMSDPVQVLKFYSVLPKCLRILCAERDIRLIQISSDGVFCGSRGAYVETDEPDATDLYGLAKYLGESDGQRSLTIRTSIIGPELANGRGLLAWFLARTGECACYTHSIFSGVTSVEFAHILKSFVLPKEDLQGVYHVGAASISKCELLRLIAKEYQKEIALSPDDRIKVDRSLDTSQFARATGYVAPSWPFLVKMMRQHTFGLA